jgi:hypothetical protein
LLSSTVRDPFRVGACSFHLAARRRKEFARSREAAHDADLYRLYNKVSDEIESRGGRVLRVRFDYEIKDELYSRIARTAKDKGRKPEAARGEVAERYHVKVVSGTRDRSSPDEYPRSFMADSIHFST